MPRLTDFLKSAAHPFHKSGTAFQVISDLHLETCKQYDSFEIPPSAPYLILAGDVGRLVDYPDYLKFLERHVSQFKYIFLVLGNHEFFGMTHAHGLRAAKHLVAETPLQGKVQLLDHTKFDIPDTNITMLGCTLWSAIATDAKEIVKFKVRDFQKILEWTVEAHNLCHQSDVSWLQRTVWQVPRERHVVVVTHHAPCVEGTSSPELAGNRWSSAFATDLIAPSKWPPNIKTWIFGHTHYSTEFEKDGIKLVSNQRGDTVKSPSGKGKIDAHEFNVRRVIHV